MITAIIFGITDSPLSFIAFAVGFIVGLAFASDDLRGKIEELLCKNNLTDKVKIHTSVLTGDVITQQPPNTLP